MQIDWEAVPGRTYTILATPGLMTASWTNVLPTGVTPTNVLGNCLAPLGGTACFYQIDRQDNEAPSIVSLTPGSNAVAVSSNAIVQVTLHDETGIATNSIILSVGAWTDMTLGSTYLSWSNSTLVFVPPSALGSAGAVITNRLTVADTLGHSLSNYTWTFEMVRPAVVTSSFLSLTAPPASPFTADGQIRSIPNVQPLKGTPELHIETVTSNTVVFSYTDTPPEVSNGTRLVSFDAAHRFYRRVVSNAVDGAQSRVTAWTVDIPLTEIMEAGSFSAGDFSSADPSLTLQGIGVDANLLHVEFGEDLSGKDLFSNTNLRLWLPECTWAFVADVDVAADIVWGGLQAFDASAKGTLTIRIKPEAIFYAAVKGDDEFPLVQPVTKVFGCIVGGVPVWVEVVMELNAGYEYSASVAGDAYTVVDVEKELTFSVQLRENEWSYGVDNPPISLECEPITWQINGKAYAKVYLRPKLTILAYSLAGLWADVVPYAEIEGEYQLNPLEYDWALYFGLSSTLGIESRIWYTNEWGEKPEWPLFNERKPLWTTNYPTVSTAPVFVDSLPNRTARPGQSLTLAGYASGIPDPSYQWYCNGSRIVGAVLPEYVIPSAQSGYAATYAVEAHNDVGSVQTSCVVTISDLGMLMNGGFEQVGSQSERAWGWEWGYPNTHGSYWGTAARVSWRTHSGSWAGAVRGQWAGDTSGGAWQELSGLGGEAYCLSGWFWADAGSYGDVWTSVIQRIKIEFFDEGGQLLSARSLALLGIGEQWVYRSFTATAPVGTRWVRAVVYADGVSAGGALMFDDLELSVAQSVAPPSGMVLIPAGSFVMGNATNMFPADEGDPEELPQHRVYVSGFYMDRYEVTKELWDVVRNWALTNGYAFAAGSGKSARHPVNSVKWYDAVKWCNARSEKEGLTPCYVVDGTTYKVGTNNNVSCDWLADGYRLPTEAEWEKAARGGLANTRFLWKGYTNRISHAKANYYGDSSQRPYDLSSGYHPSYATGGIPYTSPVGSFAPNEYGLYDMAGNVWEWCWDWMSWDYYSLSPLTDPRGPSSGWTRVIRGGGWGNSSVRSRVAVRGNVVPEGGGSDADGLRCVKGL
ncbi:MAG TPA: SUMF1/EgtB/PvdO family nonheme iron enzyme [Kiritimatiellia bacterium]|nr:SUMF1/EgtB/PvdO family nonheme iron enzyme [Kiritimatiellia bacterium]